MHVPDGRLVGAAEDVAWLEVAGPYVDGVVPPLFAGCARVPVPDEAADKAMADAALVGVLRGHAGDQPWWLGFLDTGVADLPAPAALAVPLFDMQWPYVLLLSPPERALDPRPGRGEHTPWHSALPELLFPADRSWLVATPWDDEHRCVGGPAGLVAAVLAHPVLAATPA